MNIFTLLETLLTKSSNGGFWLRILNLALPLAIPFNYGHAYRILQIGNGQNTKVKIPHKRSNWNHIRGIHACSLATGAELAAGLTILSEYTPKKYRIIMCDIHCSYTYQAKKNCIATVTPLSSEQKSQLERGIELELKGVVTLNVRIDDLDGENVCNVVVNWQVKPWSAVKSKPANTAQKV